MVFPDIDLNLSTPTPAPMAVEKAMDAAAVPLDDEAVDAQFQQAMRRARVEAARGARAEVGEPLVQELPVQEKPVEKRQVQEQSVQERPVQEPPSLEPPVQAPPQEPPPRQPPAEPVAAPVVHSASEPALDLDALVKPPAAPDLFDDEALEPPPAPRAASWRLSLMMALLAFIGVALLLGQVVYHERDLIVARQPSLRPVMSSLCLALGCEISAPRQIDDIKVDGASFTRDKNGDGFLFNFALRNVADVPLAMPAIELSLLDTRERAIVRRVLMPAEFGAPAVLPARSERAASLSLRLSGPEAAGLPPVVGFRLETLYP
jgi:hypothetical protein